MGAFETDKERYMSLLDGYLLDTIEPGEQAWVEAYLQCHEEARAALEERRAAIVALGNLPEVVTPPGLASATFARVARETAPRESSLAMLFGTVLRVAAVLCVPLVLAIILLPALGRAREAARRASCQNNLKQMALVFKVYADETTGERFPPVRETDGMWTVDLRAIFPEFLSDGNVLICPTAPESLRLQSEMGAALSAQPPDWERAHRAAAQSYTYLGWATNGVASFERLQRVRMAGHLRPTEDASDEGKKTYALREGVERFFVLDSNDAYAPVEVSATMPTIFDRVRREGGNHVPPGSNVAFLDGHVEFVKYGDHYPVLPEVEQAFPPTAPKSK